MGKLVRRPARRRRNTRGTTTATVGPVSLRHRSQEPWPTISFVVGVGVALLALDKLMRR